MHITPIEGKVFGAAVTDVDLSSLTDTDFATIHHTLLDRGFLVFPGQHLSVDDNVAFGSRFGDLEFGGMPIANVKVKNGRSTGEIIDFNSQTMRTNVGNENWHTDSTYKPISSKCAMLSAAVVPTEGGETELADARAGYAALDSATQEKLRPLSAYHSTQYSQANDIGDFPEPPKDPGAYGSIYHGEAYLRPLVKIHPETGVPSLFCGRHAFGIPGMPREESRALIRHLNEVVVADPSRTYVHHWAAGDTLLWDNRALLHRARPYPYDQPRYMIATRVAGDESELSYYPDAPEAEAGRRALAEELTHLRQEAVDRLYGATTAIR